MAKRRKALGDCRYYLHLLNNITRNLSHNPEWFFKTSLPFSHPHVSHPACVPEHLSLMTSLSNMSPRSSFNSAVRHLSLFKLPSPFPWPPSLPLVTFYTFSQFFFTKMHEQKSQTSSFRWRRGEARCTMGKWTDGSGRWAVDTRQRQMWPSSPEED